MKREPKPLTREEREAISLRAADVWRADAEDVLRYEATVQQAEARIARLKEELHVRDLLLEQREKVLRAIPECPSHGACVPWALEWVAAKIEGREPINSAEWADLFVRTGELPKPDSEKE